MMETELRPYEAIKKSSIPWIELLPKHWGIKRAKSLYFKVSRPTCETDDVVTCFRDGIVTLRKNRRTSGFTESIKEIGYQGIRKGDLVIHVMDAFAGAVGVSDSEGKATPVYSVCQPKEDLNNYYYAYIVREMAKAGFIQSLYRGIRERSSDFRFEVFANQYLPIPPRPEQDQIVKYLDHKLAKINKFIKAKKKLIAVLKEQKQAIINEAVTKGLDPNVKMKPSGIEWLGDVPAHWEILRNKNVMRLKKETVGENHGDFRLLSLTTKGVIVRDISSGKGKFPSDFSTYQVVNSGDMVFCLFDVDETPRTVGFSDENGMITGAYTIFAVTPNLRKFIYYYYLAIDDRKGLKPIYTGLRKVVSTDTFLRAKIPIPPIDEVGLIVDYLTKKITSIDRSTAMIERELDLISEYKTSLISDVVTGKVDLRHITIDEAEAIDLDDVEVDEDIVDAEEMPDAEEVEE